MSKEGQLFQSFFAIFYVIIILLCSPTLFKEEEVFLLISVGQSVGPSVNQIVSIQ